MKAQNKSMIDWLTRRLVHGLGWHSLTERARVLIAGRRPDEAPDQRSGPDQDSAMASRQVGCTIGRPVVVLDFPPPPAVKEDDAPARPFKPVLVVDNDWDDRLLYEEESGTAWPLHEVVDYRPYAAPAGEWLLFCSREGTAFIDLAALEAEYRRRGKSLKLVVLEGGKRDDDE